MHSRFEAGRAPHSQHFDWGLVKERNAHRRCSRWQHSLMALPMLLNELKQWSDDQSVDADLASKPAVAVMTFGCSLAGLAEDGILRRRDASRGPSIREGIASD